jgi:hypothetical protein
MNADGRRWGKGGNGEVNAKTQRKPGHFAHELHEYFATKERKARKERHGFLTTDCADGTDFLEMRKAGSF